MTPHYPGADSNGSSSSKSLLLRCEAGDFYIADQMTIGRSEANTIQIMSETASRIHAVVMRETDGQFVIRTSAPDLRLQVESGLVREVELKEGAQFAIGTTQFTCVRGGRVIADDDNENSLATQCPICLARQKAETKPGRIRCEKCSASLLAINAGPGSVHLLPVNVGGFSATKFVAEGGMGVVCKGVRRQDRQPVAIKFARLAKGNEQWLKRLQKEAATLKEMSHPNVVRYLGHGIVGQSFYLVMEWISGTTLRKIIDHKKMKGTLLKFSVVAPLMRQIADALRAIHDNDLIHRDVKPSNILVGKDGTAKLADLGIARGPRSENTDLTATGVMLGTYEYMAPEQLQNYEIADHRADLFALGLVFYECLTNCRPMGFSDDASNINPTVNRIANDLIRWLLAADRDKRPQSARDVVQAIDRVQNLSSSVDAGQASLVDESLVRKQQAIGPVSDAPTQREEVDRELVPTSLIQQGSEICQPTALPDSQIRPRQHLSKVLPPQTTGVFLQEEYSRILTERRWDNRISLFAGLSALLLIVASSPSIGEIGGMIGQIPLAWGIDFRSSGILLKYFCSAIGTGLFRSSVCFYARYKGHRWAWGLVLPLIVLFFFTDRRRRRLREIEGMLPTVQTTATELASLPRFFWWSTLLPIFYFTSPIALFLATKGRKDLEMKNRPLSLATFPVVWSTSWMCSLAALVLAFFVEPIKSPDSGRAQRTRENRPVGIPVVFKSPDGTVELSPPLGWLDNPEIRKSSGAPIAASCATKDLHLTIAIENKRDLVPMSLERYGKLFTESISKSLKQFSMTQKMITLKGGMLGLRIEIRGSEDNLLMLSMQMTIVETKDRFIKLVVWGTTSGMESNTDELQAVVYGLQVMP